MERISKIFSSKRTAVNNNNNNNNNHNNNNHINSLHNNNNRASVVPSNRGAVVPLDRTPVSPTNRPSLLGYFYGRITREEAELFLTERGGKEGLFLLRESMSPLGDYVISICHEDKVYHHLLQKRVDGSYMIEGGVAFAGPMELVEHYRAKGGLITHPKLPCERFTGQTPVAFRGITCHQLEKAMQIEAKKINADIGRAMGIMRDTLLRRVAANLHADMPWFHGRLSRQQAEDRLAKDQHEDGKFLVRERDVKNTFALTMSNEGRCRHYLLDMKSDQRWAIEQGPRFDCLMMLVDNYHNRTDGLFCKLKTPCCRPGYSSIDFDQYMVNNSSRRDSSPGAPRPLPPTPKTVDEAPHPNVELASTGEELESIYGSVSIRKLVVTKKLLRSQIVLENLKLGSGNFGSVMKGVCKMNGRDIPVAVKTLMKTNLEPGVQSDLMKEAEVMKSMDHKHIVRMIGICEGETLMLVLELAKLGPLNKYLSNNKQLPLWNILELMWQVAQGMAYLEANGFVHRDLAARNILLCDPHFAKISDFGLSRALAGENNEYVSSQTGKWPVKWYDVECFDYMKFDSKSDVWSFGVTLWEAVSYGAKPYYRMSGYESLEFLKKGGRLAKPINCTEEVHEVMLQCWIEARDARPTFEELVPTMKELYTSNKEAGI